MCQNFELCSNIYTEAETLQLQTSYSLFKSPNSFPCSPHHRQPTTHPIQSLLWICAVIAANNSQFYYYVFRAFEEAKDDGTRRETGDHLYLLLLMDCYIYLARQYDCCYTTVQLFHPSLKMIYKCCTDMNLKSI